MSISQAPLPARTLAMGLALIALGAWLRMDGLDWDRGALLHADERFIALTLETVSWPDSPLQYFATASSSLNPANHDSVAHYPYGTLPLVIGKLWRTLFAGTRNQWIQQLRGLSAAADIGVLWVLVIVGMRLFGPRVALLGGVLYGFAVSPIQQAHFFTVDSFLNLFLSLALLASVLQVQQPRRRRLLWVGLWWGCALATKLSALVFAPVAAMAILLAAPHRSWASRLGDFALLAAVVLLVFRLLQPYAFEGLLWPSEAFLRTVTHHAAGLSAEYGFPPAFQWIERGGWWYALSQAGAWGMGWPALLSALLGTVTLAWRRRHQRTAEWLLMGWVVIQLVLIGWIPNPALRYLLPAYGPLLLLAAWWLCEWTGGQRHLRYPRAALVIVVGSGLAWSLMFTSVYRSDHPRIAASAWIAQHVADDAVLVSEHWDEALPVGRTYSRALQLPIAERPSLEKRDALLSVLDQADYLVVSSGRHHEVLSRLPQRFPYASDWYRRLFAGVAGFELEAEFFSYPRLGGLVRLDDEAEESFTVFDHPRVFIFRKSADFDAAALTRRWEALESTNGAHGGQAQTRTAPIPVTAAWLEARRGEQWLHLLKWIALLWLLGRLGSVILRHVRAEGDFPGRVPALAVLTLAYTVGMSLGAWQNAYHYPAWTIVALAAGLWWLRRSPAVPPADPDERYAAIIFWTSFVFFVGLRFYQPAIVSGERPMDFAILNALARTSTYPPTDPWFAGEALAYHAWGQQVFAVLGGLAGIPTPILYNLAVASVPALAAELLFWTLATGLPRGRRALWAAGGGVGMLWVMGNWSAWTQWPWRDGLGYLDFWSASRITAEGINEFPFWTAVHGDLHAHYLGLVFSALVIAAWMQLRQGRAPLAGAALLGVAIASLALTNLWAAPVYVLLIVIVSLAAERSQAIAAAAALVSGTALAWALALTPDNQAGVYFNATPLAATEGLILFGPFIVLILLWGFALVGQWRSRIWLLPAAGAALLLWWPDLRGLAALMLLVTIAALASTPRHSPAETAGLFFVTAWMVVLGVEFFTVSDRMNTLFKFHFEAWVLMSAGAAFALWDMGRRTMTAVTGAVMAATATSALALSAWWWNPRQGPPFWTLDGLARLAQQSPGEAVAVAWLNQHAGPRTLLESTGARYTTHARFASATGMATLLGWPHHVWQHGIERAQIERRAADIRHLYLRPGTVEGGPPIDFAVLDPLARQTLGDQAGAAWAEINWQRVAHFPPVELWRPPRSVDAP